MRNKASVRRFKIEPEEYALFRFTVPEPSTLFLHMIASSPVNLMLMDAEDKYEYEQGDADRFSYTASWGRRIDLETSVEVGAGTWFFIVEGYRETSVGRIEVTHG